MGKLDGKTAIVTGAARGIGLEYALRLASLGANVAVCDRDLESYSDFAAESERITGGSVADTIAGLGGEAMAVQLDVTNPEAVAAFVERVSQRWGRVDVVVCNAGGGSGDPKGGHASELDLKQARDVVDRNLFGTYHTVLAAAPLMREQGSGKIITIASYAGTTAPRGGSYADYAVAKAAVAHYTRYLAQDLAPHNVTANAIAPGLIGTGQWKARFADDDPTKLDQSASLVPMGRLGTARDCANILEFLATDLSDYVTGQVIAVDGGMAAWPT